MTTSDYHRQDRPSYLIHDLSLLNDINSGNSHPSLHDPDAYSYVALCKLLEICLYWNSFTN